MNIKDVYNQRQEEYQQYQIKQGIYNDRCAELRKAFYAGLADVVAAASECADFSVKSQIAGLQGINIENMSADALSTLHAQLTLLSESVETEARRILGC